MNEDASRGVDARVKAGADVPFLSGAGWGALAGGLLMLALAATLAVLGLRSRRPVAGLDPQSRAAGWGSGSFSSSLPMVVRSARSARLASASGSRASAISEATMPIVKATATNASEPTGPM